MADELPDRASAASALGAAAGAGAGFSFMGGVPVAGTDDKYQQRFSPAIQVQIGEVAAPLPLAGTPLLDRNVKFGGKDPTRTGLTTDYRLKSYYWNDKHRYMMGVTAPNENIAIVQLCEPTLLWICDWTAQKLGAPPEIPNPLPQSVSRWVLLDEHYVPASVMATQDGSAGIYRISGTYVYACLVPNASTYKDISFPIGAWLKASFFQRILSVQDLNSELLEPVQGTGNSQQQGSLNQRTRG